jgi:thioredoxin-like negative regulator of GroEL
MHREWLRSRLEEEHAAAEAALARAQSGTGSVGDALVAIARSLARQAKFAEAEEVYRALEAQIGESPELRFHRAVELLSVTNPAQARAELAAVVAARPLLGRPAFELAKLLERAGEIDAALAAYATAIERADRTALSGEGDGGDDWAVEAVDREETLQLLRLAGTSEPAPAR